MNDNTKEEYILEKLFEEKWYYEGKYTNLNSLVQRAFELGKYIVYTDVRVREDE